MANSYHLNLVTPERIVLSEEVQETNAPGTEGYLGIQARHAPLLTELMPGEVNVIFADGRSTAHLVISGGFLEMSADGKATLLADHAERVSDIDPSHAERELEAARQMLEKLDPETANQAEAQAAVVHAETRVRVSRNR